MCIAPNGQRFGQIPQPVHSFSSIAGLAVLLTESNAFFPGAVNRAQLYAEIAAFTRTTFLPFNDGYAGHSAE